MAKAKSRRQQALAAAKAKARVQDALAEDAGAAVSAAPAVPAKMMRALVREAMFDEDAGETARDIVRGMIKRAKHAERDSDRQRAAETLLRYCEAPPPSEKPIDPSVQPPEGTQKTLMLVVRPEDVERMAPDNPMHALVRKQIDLEAVATVRPVTEEKAD